MKRLLILLIVAAAALAACGEDDSPAGAGSSEGGGARESAHGGSSSARAADTEPADTEPAATAPADTEAAPSARGPLVKLRDSQLGPVLFSGSDRAVYFFTRDPRNRSRCYGACATAWPPFYAKARPRAGRGVHPDLLGTIRRRNGRRQVTYKGQPLYFYVHDPRGKVFCNDIVEFGGTWFAVTAEGSAPA
jgi:predicted lipoprotein with Yx(FWY)xxD motif